MAIVHAKGICLVTESSSDEFLLQGVATDNLKGNTLSRAYVFGREIFLSKSESDFLELLMTHPGRVFARKEILDFLDDFGAIFERSIDQIVKRLRRKLFPQNKIAGALFIVTIYCRGYKVNT